jgi:hypothetical protein
LFADGNLWSVGWVGAWPGSRQQSVPVDLQLSILAAILLLAARSKQFSRQWVSPLLPTLQFQSHTHILMSPQAPALITVLSYCHFVTVHATSKTHTLPCPCAECFFAACNDFPSIPTQPKSSRQVVPVGGDQQRTPAAVDHRMRRPPDRLQHRPPSPVGARAPPHPRAHRARPPRLLRRQLVGPRC